MKFRALTFNMQFGQAWDPVAPDKAPIRLDDTISFLLNHPHDVYLLQELEQALPGGEQTWPPPNFTRLQSALSGYHAGFAYPRANPDELPFGIGLAIFSRTPLTGFQNIELPPAPIQFAFEGACKVPSARQLITATTRIADTTVHLMNTHLQAFFMINASSNEHREQRDLVGDALRNRTEATLLGGDFNCSPDENIVEQYRALGYQTAQTTEITWRHRPYVTDHLFYNAALEIEHTEVIQTPVSDHHAVSATFRIVPR